MEQVFTNNTRKTEILRNIIIITVVIGMIALGLFLNYHAGNEHGYNIVNLF